jgi:hypothetical protein
MDYKSEKNALACSCNFFAEKDFNSLLTRNNARIYWLNCPWIMEIV